jgi:acetylornithine deacetylase/succinyl-diaminopimelate desuccinylase-like protein
MPAESKVIEALERGFERALADLVELARIPGVSASGFAAAELERSAASVASLCRGAGLERVDVLRVGDSHPYVVAEWCRAAPGAPTVLVYAHHDVQPPGRLEKWETPAFEPTLRADGRLYGRGVVDDKAGFVVYLAALRAWLESRGALPLNVKLVVEGEEEIGSPHLAEFLRAQRERLAADVIVLSDTANLERGLPSITTSLRGLANLDVTVRALEHPVHSGMWGGALPDAATALARLLARLVDARGEPAVPGLADDVPPVDAATRARLASLPFDERGFREDAGLPATGRLAGDPARPVWERLWLRPAIAVTALEGMPLASAANQLMAEARARVGVRLAPGQSARRAAARVREFLLADPPLGAQVEVREGSAADGWRTRATGPAFDAARRALRSGYGREPVEIGCGGSIPFVGPFAEILGAPALLLGLEDPRCNAHGENESLDLEDFRSAARAAAHLLEELRALPARAAHAAASP